MQYIYQIGGAVAELLSGEKINENKKDPWFAPRPGQNLKKYRYILIKTLESAKIVTTYFL